MASRSQSKVCFFFEGVRPWLPERQKLKLFIEKVFVSEKTRLRSLNYVFCTDKRLLEINRQYLKHDFYTDIISFDLSEPGSGLTGEIYISVDRVRDNAQKLGISFKKELHRVIFHGVLHFCGHKDKRPQHVKEMRKAEEKYLNMYFSG